VAGLRVREVGDGLGSPHDRSLYVVLLASCARGLGC
jgi:hypothetical protein